MANIAFYQPSNMDTGVVWYGYVTQATGSLIQISDGYLTGNYFGTFTYGFNGLEYYLAGGTVTGYTQYVGAELHYQLYYDADGSGTGDAQAITTLANGAMLTAADIFVGI